MDRSRHGPGDLSAPVVSPVFPGPAESPPMVDRLARPDSGGDSQRPFGAGADHRGHAPPPGPLAAGALGGLANLCFCAENEIPGGYRRSRHGAVLGGPKGHVNTRVLPAVVFIFRIAKQYERLFAKTESLSSLLSNVGTPDSMRYPCSECHIPYGRSNSQKDRIVNK